MTGSELILNVAIGWPYDVRSVVAQCRRLLGTPEAVPLLTKKISNPLLPSGNGRIYNPPAWDLPASLLVQYGIDGPMQELTSPDATEEDRQQLADDPSSNGWAAIEVELRPSESWGKSVVAEAMTVIWAPG